MGPLDTPPGASKHSKNEGFEQHQGQICETFVKSAQKVKPNEAKHSILSSGPSGEHLGATLEPIWATQRNATRSPNATQHAMEHAAQSNATRSAKQRNATQHATEHAAQSNATRSATQRNATQHATEHATLHCKNRGSAHNSRKHCSKSLFKTSVETAVGQTRKATQAQWAVWGAIAPLEIRPLSLSGSTEAVERSELNGSESTGIKHRLQRSPASNFS